MHMTTFVRGLGLVAALAVTGCKSLDITNPNDPDAERALADPAAIEAITGGAVRIWFNTYEGLEATGPLVTQAQTYSSSWNNFNMNFYSGIDLDGTRNSRGWQNNPSAAGRTSIEHYWNGYYSVLSLATNVVKAIRNNGLIITNVSDTRRAEAVALLMQGAALSGIALNYDKGYVIDENTDLATLTYSDRRQLRDAARAKFDDAIAVATANTFTTPLGWFGPGDLAYTNVQIAKMANTMAAELLAAWPRNETEAASQVPWAAVATYASNGLSSGTAFDMEITGDGTSVWNPQILAWFNDISSGRVHTRVANLLDPTTQTTPWPLAGNPQPNSLDRRLGDGSFGNASTASSFSTTPRTVNGGTDFAWSSVAIFNMARGSYHQSNIAHVRYDYSGLQDPNGLWGGIGDAPVYSNEQNELLWAEALLETGDLAGAATHINSTRVTRGGLPAAAAGDGAALLRQRLRYEQDVELLGLGPASYYPRRRTAGALLTGTPREMPVPAQELGVFGQALYTWGGATPNSPTPP
jgi:starch-binding outer membrane protein, SusD/RagB family